MVQSVIFHLKRTKELNVWPLNTIYALQILFSTWSYYKINNLLVCEIDNQYIKHVYAFKGIESLYFEPKPSITLLMYPTDFKTLHFMKELILDFTTFNIIT